MKTVFDYYFRIYTEESKQRSWCSDFRLVQSKQGVDAPFFPAKICGCSNKIQNPLSVSVGWKWRKRSRRGCERWREKGEESALIFIQSA